MGHWLATTGRYWRDTSPGSGTPFHRAATGGRRMCGGPAGTDARRVSQVRCRCLRCAGLGCGSRRAPERHRDRGRTRPCRRFLARTAHMNGDLLEPAGYLLKPAERWSNRAMSHLADSGQRGCTKSSCVATPNSLNRSNKIAWAMPVPRVSMRVAASRSNHSPSGSR